MTDYYKIFKMLLDGYSRRDIAATLGVSPKSITKCKKIIDQNSITVERSSQISEEQIMAMIPQRKTVYDTETLKPDFKTIHIALVNGESLASLFEKYTCQCKVNGEKALKQSRFYKLVKDYEATARATSDNNLRPGSIMYVAWFPLKIQIVDYETGEILSASVLYGILPYSQQLVLACAREKNVNALVKALNAFFVRLNGIPKCLIIEKGTSTYCKIQGVRQLQPQLHHMLDYYGMAVAENKLSDIVKTEILTRVKSVEKELFTGDPVSYNEFQLHLLQCERKHNSVKVHERMVDTIYGENEFPFMSALPENLYELYTDIMAKVQINCHIQFEQHWYSVPWKYQGEVVSVHGYAKRVEIYAGTVCIANHKRLFGKAGTYSTCVSHMPSEKESTYLPWNKKRFISWAKRIGPYTGYVIEKLLVSKAIEQQVYRSCLSILHMGDNGKECDLEQSCQDYKETGRCNPGIYRYIKEAMENIAAD